MARTGNKWADKLLKIATNGEGEDYDPFAHILRSPSPSVNFIFGNTHGIPSSYTAVFYGPPKAGKTILVNAIIGQLHQDDPEAIAVKFDTEMRERGQMTGKQAQIWGIDPSRYICYSTNKPNEIFDRIEHDIAGMCDEGMPLKLLVIDSITGIMGRRALNADTIDTQQIGDDAKTQGDGLKRILPVLRKHKITCILNAHVRAELDMGEQMRGNKVKMAAAWQLQHFAEYFVYVEPNRSKEGKTDLLGNKLEDDSVTDMMDKAERTGHKIRATMKDSSCGPKGRVGEFTFDHSKGIVNVHEEVFQLGVNRGIVERPNNVTYRYQGKEWRGKPAFLEALKDNEQLRADIIKELIRRDAAGLLPDVLVAGEIVDG